MESRVRLPALGMLETWPRESGVRLPALVTRETWLQESRVRIPATRQLCFCSLIFVDYVLILNDYQMAFLPTCSVVYALGLVRLFSRYYAVPQCSSMHPIAVCSCPVCRSRSDSPSSLLALFLLASRCFTGHRSVHVAALCAYRPATRSAFRLRHVIGLPSSPIILVGFLVTSVVSIEN